ncbi:MULTISPECIES: H-type lectin domain-containing protein [unclassified Moorena]|uniref:H-type lectin domain-containing protein n=1 Tax=unclassified Moorena TaxID=2683338 RepID=UPI0013BAC3DA|nr:MULTISPECIES: H-type lectin domain-containing protein [unclassified Moorena]NEO72285.1 hypothetical protein [Moorena sp. SIO3H5]NEO77226.1 hypothetical protein [Moorena sp. SIO4G3]
MVTSHDEHDTHIFGVVRENGDILSGKGFKVDKKRDGIYFVVFDQPFAEIPGVTCTISGHSWLSFQMSISVVDIRPNYFVCQTSTPDRPEDSGFSFIAVGEV